MYRSHAPCGQLVAWVRHKVLERLRLACGQTVARERVHSKDAPACGVDAWARARGGRTTMVLELISEKGLRLMQTPGIPITPFVPNLRDRCRISSIFICSLNCGGIWPRRTGDGRGVASADTLGVGILPIQRDICHDAAARALERLRMGSSTCGYVSVDGSMWYRFVTPSASCRLRCYGVVNRHLVGLRGRRFAYPPSRGHGVAGIPPCRTVRFRHPYPDSRQGARP